MTTQFIPRSMTSVAMLLFGAFAGAEALPERELEKRMAVFGDGFLIDAIDAPVIADPQRWLARRSGDYVYRFTSGDDDGAIVQTERHIPDPDDPDSWKRQIGERLVESFTRADDRDVFIVEEVDHKHGFQVVIAPGVRWPADIEPGQEWRTESTLAVYDLESGEHSRDGRLESTITYEGAFRVKTPAGTFDTVLLREDFLLHVGPLKAEDDRFLFYARGVGLVAEIEGIRASALLVFHAREDSAKVLTSYPGGEGTETALR